MKEPEINVGIVNALEIAFTLNAKFLAKGETVSGKQRVSFDEGGISWNGNVYRELTFTPLEDDASFSLEDVTIGINFHWERQETQTFLGTLRLVVDEGKITAINQVVKFVSILAGVTTAMRAGESGGALRGACVGVLYMALGIACYALMMGQSPQWTAYLADLGMGIAAGGLFGMILTTRKNG